MLYLEVRKYGKYSRMHCFDGALVSLILIWMLLYVYVRDGRVKEMHPAFGIQHNKVYDDPLFLQQFIPVSDQSPNAEVLNFWPIDQIQPMALCQSACRTPHTFRNLVSGMMAPFS